MCGVQITFGNPMSGEFFGGSFGQRRFIDQFAARGVHDARRLLHFLNGLGIDHFLRRGTQRAVHGNKIALCQKFVQCHQPDLQLFACGFADVRIIGNHFHIERFGAPRDFAANSSQSNQPQSFAAQFCSAG